MEMDYLFPRRKEEALISRLRRAKEEVIEENRQLKAENEALQTKNKALEENLATMETKLRIQRHAWEDLARKDVAKQPSKQGGVEKILKGVPSQREQSAVKPPMPSLNLGAISKEAVPAAHRPASSRPMSARPVSARPVSARPVSARPPSGRVEARARPFSAREHAAARPFSARRPIQSHTTRDGAVPMVNLDNKSTSHVFTRFAPQQKMKGEPISFGAFSARTVLSQSESSAIAKTISEQSASFESLGIHLQCAWAEVLHGTASEPAPNFFRLAICCSIFDKVCGVVGKYSDLLLRLRSELYGSLFLDFNPAKHLPDDTDYAKLLPFFIELKRVDLEQQNTLQKASRIRPLARAPSSEADAVNSPRPADKRTVSLPQTELVAVEASDSQDNFDE